MKKDIGFRFSEEVHAKLEELAKAWGCTRTRVLEDLVLHPEASLHYRMDPLKKLSEKTLPDGSVQTIYGQGPKPDVRQPKETKRFPLEGVEVTVPTGTKVEGVEISGKPKKVTPVKPLTKGTPFVSKPADPGGIASTGRGSIKRSVPIPKPDWKK